MLYVISGPPAAGKSTYVRGRAKPGDVIVDYDLIAGALSAPGTGAGTGHDHRGAVKDCAFRARSAAIREALRHIDSVNVFIIHSLPPAEALARYAEHDAQLVVVDPGQDVVLARIAEQRPPSARAVAMRWYSQASKGHPGTLPTPTPTGHRHPVHTPTPSTSRTW